MDCRVDNRLGTERTTLERASLDRNSVGNRATLDDRATVMIVPLSMIVSPIGV